MPTCKEIQAELEKLYAQAEEARLAEKATVLDKIKAMIVEYELLPSDFGFSTTAKRRSNSVAVKYKDPATGATWSGRGHTPKWVEDDKAKYEV